MEPADPTLVFNNVRYATFEVRRARRVLTIADKVSAARSWRLALEAGRAFDCEVITPGAFNNLALNDLNEYQAITLLGLTHPDADLWAKLATYVHSGGSLAVVPGGSDMAASAYNDLTAQQLLPGTLAANPVVRQQDGGVFWQWTDRIYQHSLMKRFQEWNNDPATDFVRYPRRTSMYWQIRPLPSDQNWVAHTLIRYADKAAPPALLEHLDKKPGGGRVLLFTTRMDEQMAGWNDYKELNSFYFTLVREAMGYLVGDADRRSFNYISGQPVLVRLPATATAPTYTIQGPGLVGADADRAAPRQGQYVGSTASGEPRKL